MDTTQPLSQGAKTAIVILLLLTVSPIGLYLMFKWMSWKTWAKVLITMALAVYFLFILLGFYFFILPLRQAVLNPNTGDVITETNPQKVEVIDQVKKWCGINKYDICDVLDVSVDEKSASAEVRVRYATGYIHLLLKLNRDSLGEWSVSDIDEGPAEGTFIATDIDEQWISIVASSWCAKSGYNNCSVSSVEIDGDYALATTSFTLMLLVKDGNNWRVVYGSPKNDICSDVSTANNAELTSYCAR